MLIMWASKLKGFLGLLKQKKIWLPSAVVLVAAIGLTIALLVTHKSAPTPTGPTTPQPPSRSQLANFTRSAITQNLSQHDYAQAVSNYLSEAALAQTAQQSVSILLDATKKIPDQNVPWYLYDSLAVYAKNAKDKTTEITSLQKALAKAQQSGSGAKASIIQTYQQELKSLGADGG